MSPWFEQLFGFPETTYAETKSRFAVESDAVDGGVLVSLPTGRRFGVGTFTTPSLHDLRERSGGALEGTLRVSHEVIGDVLELHALPENDGAMFQVASQLNCLEFPNANVTPEDGVTGYANDPTQGPACSLAAAAATVYRNYFADVGGHEGQTATRQLEGLAGVQRALGQAGSLVQVRNGYTFSDDAALERLNRALAQHDRRELMGELRIGVQIGAEVTFARRFTAPAERRRVSQAFCSALSCGYSSGGPSQWRPLATLVLDGAYEATMLAAALAATQAEGGDTSAGSATAGDRGKVWLTFIGGGVFGNSPEWIADAIGRALRRAEHLALDVRIAHFRRLDERMVRSIDEAASRG